MSRTHIHENDLGTEFIVQVVDAVTADPIDLTDYTTKEIIFESPDGTTATKTAVAEDLTNGKIKWVSTAGFLTPAGVWKLQAHVAHSGNGTDHKTEVVPFKVYANIV